MIKNKILILSGDPNSINSEIIYKSWKSLSNSTKRKIFFITNYKLINSQFRKLKYSIKVKKIRDLDEFVNYNCIKIIDVDINFNDPFKVKTAHASKFVKKSLNLAHKLAQRKDVKGIINCPVDKKLINNKGVTEYLAYRCKIKKNTEVMLIKSKNLAVSPLTTHEDIKNISKKIDKNCIVKKVFLINSWYKKKFNIKPRIGVLGLNPHNAELKKSSEEKKIIIPSLTKLKKKGINVTGPLVADTVFIENFKKFDVIVGMYHDQVLAPFKSIYKFDAINLTLGLKYLRVSPDHGVASNLIGKNKANPSSLLNCINFLKNFN